MNTKRSETLFERARLVSPGGVHSPVRAFKSVGGVPRFIQSARGAEIADVDGNSYVDFCMSWGPLILGHADPEVAEAVHKAIDRGWSYGAAEQYSLELAEFITGNLPWVEKIRFVNSGTEAVMSALRVARAATGRSRILKFDGCYHGHADSMLVRSGSGLAEMASPDSAGVSAAVASETLVVPLDDPDALEKAFALHGNTIAAAIVEPVPANNGLLPHREGLLKKLALLSRKNGALLIFDEVITGFRTGFEGMAGISGIKPDLVTYGKIIGGGFPVGAYGGRRDLLDLVAPAGPVYQAGTLSANPVAMTAGLATLKKLFRDKPYEQLSRRTGLLAGLVSGKTGGRIRIQHFSSIFWPVFGDPSSSDGVVHTPAQAPAGQKEAYTSAFHKLLSRGFYLSPSGYEVSFMSTAHTDDHAESLADALVLAAG